MSSPFAVKESKLNSSKVLRLQLVWGSASWFPNLDAEVHGTSMVRLLAYSLVLLDPSLCANTNSIPTPAQVIKERFLSY